MMSCSTCWALPPRAVLSIIHHGRVGASFGAPSPCPWLPNTCPALRHQAKPLLGGLFSDAQGLLGASPCPGALGPGSIRQSKAHRLGSPGLPPLHRSPGNHQIPHSEGPDIPPGYPAGGLNVFLGQSVPALTSKTEHGTSPPLPGPLLVASDVSSTAPESSPGFCGNGSDAGERGDAGERVHAAPALLGEQRGLSPPVLSPQPHHGPPCHQLPPRALQNPQGCEDAGKRPR